jgi:hypothetical protein
VNCSRNLAIKICDLVKADDAELQRCRKAIVGFPYRVRACCGGSRYSQAQGL